jgi:hypothetical protein
VTAFLVASVVATTWAECIGAYDAPAQMACCVRGHLDCGTEMTATDCCEQTATSEPTFVTTGALDAIRVPVVHGVVTVLSPSPVFSVSSLVGTTLLRFTRPHDPPHLRASSLLI